MSIIKKFALLLAIFAALSLSHFQVAFAYPQCVAIIVNYEELQGRIHIDRANGKPPGSDAMLYPGDKITGDVAYITFECAPYADFHNVNNQYYLISYDPPTGLDKYANELHEFTNIFVKKVDSMIEDNPEPSKSNVTRGSKYANTANYGFDLNPRLGFNTTLMNNQKVTFAGVATIDNFGRAAAPKGYVVKDSSGQTIFSGTFNNGEATLDLSTQNLKAGEKYSWIVDGNAEYDFTIIDADTTKKIQDIFAQIDAKNTSPEKRNLEKAFWAQYISDTSKGKINLYWLSAQLLMEISPNSDDDQADKYRLLQKCYNHLMEEFDAY